MIRVKGKRARRQIDTVVRRLEGALERKAAEVVVEELEDLVRSAARRWGQATGQTARSFRVKAKRSPRGFVVTIENLQPSARWQSKTRYRPTYFETLIVEPLRKRAREIGERVILELGRAADGR